jgi:hypothetical protein
MDVPLTILGSAGLRALDDGRRRCAGSRAPMAGALRRMLACVDKGEVPKGFRRQQLKDAASTIREYLRRQGRSARPTEAISGKAAARQEEPANASATTADQPRSNLIARARKLFQDITCMLGAE